MLQQMSHDVTTCMTARFSISTDSSWGAGAVFHLEKYVKLYVSNWPSYNHSLGNPALPSQPFLLTKKKDRLTVARFRGILENIIPLAAGSLFDSRFGMEKAILEHLRQSLTRYLRPCGMPARGVLFISRLPGCSHSQESQRWHILYALHFLR